MKDYVSTNGNQILARLPKAEAAQFMSQMQPLEFVSGKVLYEARASIEYAYFPTRGTLSAVAMMSDGRTIEVATIGNEGAVGVPILSVADRSPNRVIVQVPGDGLRISAKVLEAAAERSPTLKQLLIAYHTAFLFQISQSVACNGLHRVDERSCRWLMMTLDRVEGDHIDLTHELLATMLGVRRPGVTEVLHGLQVRGLIRCSRGRVTVIDRKGLEAGSCECYKVVRDEYARLLD